MRVIGAAVHWAGANVHPGDDRLTRAIVPQRTELSEIHVFPHGKLVSTVLNAADGAAEPGEWSAAQSVVAVADARIDNWTELRRDLDILGRPLSSSALIAKAYERWGEGFAHHLVGDFAAIVWDPKNRRIVLARDPFGARPLYYVATTERLLAASAVEHLLAALDSLPSVEPASAVDYLRDHLVGGDRTMFRGVKRVRAGHFVSVDSDRFVEQRHWRAPAKEIDLATDEYRRGFRDLLGQSVRDRLVTDQAVLCHLSGGLDSTSIAVLADGIRPADPLLRGISQVFEGLDCDESAYIAAVERRLSMPVERWDGRRTSLLDVEAPARSTPGVRTRWIGGSRGDLDIARHHRAGVVLSGDGGDSLTYGAAVLRDLAFGNRWLTLARELSTLPESPRRRGQLARSVILGDAVRRGRGLLPDSLRAAYRALRPPVGSDVPDWLTPEAAAFWPRPERPMALRPRGTSFLQDAVFDALTSDNIQSALEAHRVYGLEAGLEYRFPLLDRRLAEFVLSVPAAERLLRGRMRRLHEEAMFPLLPPEVRNRRRKASFSSAWQHQNQVALPLISEILRARDWHCGDFVVQSEAQLLLERTSVLPPANRPWRDCARLWNIVTLEAWLRRRND